ncbi:FAD-dependent monooxygenase [Caballeronia sp. dw_19]|uniref:FAD-dependent monooxygenase n=1 Tax=unclassified Caballeronia TaxID=2646786 RepID=UPI00210547A4|nr:FAD-dependent monooxygenase [Caballeronia sp. dw_19]
MMQESTDVLIVGAGPVGLLLATELCRDGVNVCVIEQHAGRTFFCKALGVTARTLEIFDDLGIALDAIDAGVWLTGVETWSDGTPAQRMQVPSEGLPYGSLSLAQYETERLLEAALERQGGHVTYGWSLTGFVETADDVAAQLAGPDGESQTLRCRWIVGCDGARSAVRAQLGLPFEGGQYPQTFALADVDVDWTLPRGPMYRFNWSEGAGRTQTSLAAVPVRGSVHRYRLSIIIASDETATRLAATPSPDFNEVCRLMLPALPDGTQLSAMRWSSVYRVSHRIASTYQAGRAFIAGDAAHLHPPVGGQGMNTGLQDAHNLAWKLALAAKNQALPALLDSYSAERHPVGLDVVQSTSRALNTVLAQGVMTPALRETQLLVSYRDSPVAIDACAQFAAELPAPGDRVPEVGGLRQAFIGHPLRLQDRLGRGRHVLVGYVDCAEEQYVAFVEGYRALHAVLGSAAAGILILAPGSAVPSDESITVLNDTAGEFAAAFHAPGGTVWMVRPDGHIGWRSSECSALSVTSWLQRSVVLTNPIARRTSA